MQAAVTSHSPVLICLCPNDGDAAHTAGQGHVEVVGIKVVAVTYHDVVKLKTFHEARAGHDPARELPTPLLPPSSTDCRRQRNRRVGLLMNVEGVLECLWHLGAIHDCPMVATYEVDRPRDANQGFSISHRV